MISYRRYVYAENETARSHRSKACAWMSFLKLQSSYRFLLIWLLMYMKMESFRLLIFAAGGVTTPADAALMMQLGAEGVFVWIRYLQIR